VEADFHRKHRYVRYLEREGITDGEALFEFLADLRTDEAATVERIQRRMGTDDAARTPAGGNVSVRLPNERSTGEPADASNDDVDVAGNPDGASAGGQADRRDQPRRQGDREPASSAESEREGRTDGD
jgi:hypothetical protein